MQNLCRRSKTNHTVAKGVGRTAEKETEYGKDSLDNSGKQHWCELAHRSSEYL